jgi:uncharacterized membrane protein YdjX (TVP38/TMEM64 family)
MDPQRRNWLSLLAFPLFLLGLIALTLVFRSELWNFFKDREQLRTWILGWGWAGFAAFILLQVIQVVIFVIPGEVVQIAGGYVFGLWGGVFLSIVGIGLGSLVNFAAGRILGRPFVVSLFGEAKVAQIEGVASSGKGAAAMFLLFVIPGIPKDILCYAAGLTRLAFPVFLGISMAGRLPGIIGSSFMGQAAYSANYTGAMIVLAFASLLFVVGLLNRDRIVAFIGKVMHRGR